MIMCKACLLSLLDWKNTTRTTDSHLKRIIRTNCCVHTVVPPDDGHRYARNMYRLTKYTKNKLCIKLVFVHTICVFSLLMQPHSMCHYIVNVPYIHAALYDVNVSTSDWRVDLLFMLRYTKDKH